MRNHEPSADELARARLAYVSLGQPALSAPRRGAAAELPPDDPLEVVPPAPAESNGGWLARVQPSRTHLIALAAVVAVVVVVLALSLGRSAATEVPAAPAVESSAPPEAESQPEPEPTPPVSDVRVHVIGGVRHPGVVTVPGDAIVADAIEAAGGFSDDAVPGTLNLAAPVAAGMQVQVGTGDDESRVEGGAAASGATSGGGGGGEADGKINLNTASAQELESLPGVGPVTAQAIIQWREEHGGFTSPAELQEISGIGPKTFAKLEPHVSV